MVHVDPLGNSERGQETAHRELDPGDDFGVDEFKGMAYRDKVLR
jgi:hypothetical protein